MLDIPFLQHVFDDASFFDDIGRGGEEDPVEGDGFGHLDLGGCWIGDKAGTGFATGAMAGVAGAD